ncbi:MAG: DNA repair protein RadC [Rikenellaceae bacterium]
MLTIQEIIEVRGVEALSDIQILTYILGDNQQAQLQAEQLLKGYNNSLSAVAKEDISRLRMVEGIGLKRAIQIKISAELGRRSNSSNSANDKPISSSSDVFQMFQPYFDSMKHEECWILFLSASNKIIERYRVSQGGITATVVDHRLIIKRALELLSTQIIIIHNHPSGAVDPSREDIELTQKIKRAAMLFDISIVDHIIISSSNHYSFRNNGLL